MPLVLTHSVPALSSLLRWSIGTASSLALLNAKDAAHGIVAGARRGREVER